MTRSRYSLEAKRICAHAMRNQPTVAEHALWQRLRGRQTGFTFHRQSLQRGYILDFYCHRLKLAIEIDGSVHQLQRAADARREQALRARNIKVLHFTNRDVLDSHAWVLRRIAAEILLRDSERLALATAGKLKADIARCAIQIRTPCNPFLERPERADVEPA
jgi:very-short-patch-repair endonuclease